MKIVKADLSDIHCRALVISTREGMFGSVERQPLRQSWWFHGSEKR